MSFSASLRLCAIQIFFLFFLVVEAQGRREMTKEIYSQSSGSDYEQHVVADRLFPQNAFLCASAPLRKNAFIL